MGRAKPQPKYQTQSTFTDAGWDFVGEMANGTHEVWQIPAGGGYPILSSFNGYSPPVLTGKGTSDNPYLIGDPNELGAIYHYDSSANYRLGSDMDLSGINWSIAPIPRFNGRFDGNGYTITVLTIEGGKYLGLFGYVGSGGEIKNMGMTNVSVSGYGSLGCLVGNNSGIISNCYVTGSVHGSDGSNLGGLVGYNNGSISDCYATGNVSGDGGLGGLVGRNPGIISNCYATGSVSSGGDSYDLGCLVGNNSGRISDCYATGSISGGDNSRYIGGLVGYNYRGIISNCYATGTVNGGDGSNYIGGLVGYNYHGIISNCYATGTVNGGDGSGYIGGLVGSDHISGSFYTRSFWNSSVNPTLAGIGNKINPEVEGKTTTQMQTQSTFTNAGWDFVGETANGTSEVWQMPTDGGYPVLSNFNGYSPPELSGNGTSGDPYIISNAAELGAIYHYDNSACYQLYEDIDLTGINWLIAPIPFFRGCFDGNSRTITALTIEGSGYLGLFGYVSDGSEIKNLGMINISVSGDKYIGGLVGYNRYGSISNCYATSTVSGGSNSDYIGGLVGRNYYGSINNCYATSIVSGGSWSEYLGGLVGENYFGNISNCYATGSVSGDDYIGGLVGHNYYGSASNCYATGSVSGGYSSDYLGGLVGKNNCSTSNSFWDIETSGMTRSSGGTGKTTAQMQNVNTFLDAGWDFVGETANGTDDLWKIRNSFGYPLLAWQEYINGDFTGGYSVDLMDFAVLAQTWGLSSGQTNYNDLCDLVDNDIIDIADLMIFCQNWLEGR